MKKTILILTLLIVLFSALTASSVWEYGPDGDGTLVSYWDLNKGNGTFFSDKSGYGNNGTCSGTSCPAYTNKGRFQQGYDFDGVDDYINVSYDTSLDFGIGDFTFTYWFKPNSLDAYDTIISHDNPDDKNDLIMGFGSISNFRVFCRDSGNDAISLETGSVSIGEWQLFTAVRNGDTIYLYKNGIFVASDTNAATGSCDNPSNWYIGSNSGVSRHFNGSIDEVRIYNRSLTASEIRELYNESLKSHSLNTFSNGSASTVSNSSLRVYGSGDNGLINETGLVGLWHFDGNAIDSSGTGNHGGVSGATVTNKGRFKQAYDLDGDNDAITVTGDTGFALGNNGTWCVWFKFQLGGTYDNVMPIWRESDQFGLYLRQTSSARIRARGGGINGDYDTTTIQANTWHHVCGVLNAGNLKLYIDGSQKESNDGAGSITVGTALYFGRDSSADNYFHGIIDEGRVYNRALTAGEIKQLWRRTKKSHSEKVYGSADSI